MFILVAHSADEVVRVLDEAWESVKPFSTKYWH